MAFVGLIGVSRTLLGFEALGRRVSLDLGLSTEGLGFRV